MIEVIGMVGTRDASEVKGPLVDGPVVDWTEGAVIEPGYLSAIARSHDEGGFDRVLVGYGAVGPEGWAVASHVLSATRQLKVLVAHRPGPVEPVLLARQAATLDHLSGGGRVAVHFITGGDEADQRREGDFVAHDDRYRRTAEAMALVRRVWAEPAPFDHAGEFYRYEGAFSSVKPVTTGGIPLFFGGASPAAVRVGAAHADVYALWGEPLGPIAERRLAIENEAAKRGRTLRYSASFRPVIAATERAAWERAEWIASEAAVRIDRAKGRVQASASPYHGLGGASTSIYSVDRDVGGTTSVGRMRLMELSGERDVYDERLFMKVASLTGGAGNSTALVGTPDQVTEALLRYHDLGITTFILKGFDPLEDATRYGEELLPRLRRAVLAKA